MNGRRDRSAGPAGQARPEPAVPSPSRTYLSAQSSDLLLDPDRAGLRHVALLAIRPVQGGEVALDALVDLLHSLANLGHREVLVAIVHGFELAAVDCNYGLRKQAQSTAQLDELAAHRSDRRAVVSTEVGDGLEVWSQSARQPYQLNIALSLSLKAAARLEPIGWVKLGPGKGLPWVILSGIWYKALLILGNYIRN